jgi:hypothetical protein
MALTSHPAGSRSRGRRHSAIVIFVCALLFGMTAADSTTRPPLPITPHGPWTTRTIDGEISLSVPTTWEAGDSWTTPGSFETLVGSLSNQTLVPPCTTTLNSITCGPPLDSLQPGGVLVEVFNESFLVPWNFNDQPGTSLLVSGLPAKLNVTTGINACGDLQADRGQTELIAYPDAIDNYFGITVCSRGVPNAITARVMDSVQVTPLG